MNMGPKARRQVRGLKVGLGRKEEGSLVLGSASDVVMRCVGKRGFTAVRSCRVGVPVASVVEATSSSDSTSEPSLKDSKSPSPLSSKIRDKGKGKGKSNAPESTHPPPHKIKEEPSFTQLLSDPSPKADHNISKMVAKVGRWWYYRCYESVLLNVPDSPTMADTSLSSSSEANAKGKGKEVAHVGRYGGRQHSIFDDSAILRECEAWSSSFKLMVAYAQKPVEAGRRRRTASV